MTEQIISVVTGGAGFIGSHMVDLLLSEGHHVRVIDNFVGGRSANVEHVSEHPNFSIAIKDINELEPGDVVFDDADYVFHFAGIGDIVPSIEQPIDYMQTNVQGTVRVLECARHAGVGRFIYAASSSCYGLASTPTEETHPISPEYPYALSKYMGERAAFHWQDVYGLPVNSVRIFNAYGTRSRTSGAYGAVFGVFLRQKISGDPLTVVGDGSQTRDFLYVTDVARAFLAVASCDAVGEVFNLGASSPQSVNTLVELLECETVTIPSRPGEPDCTWANINKILEMTDWTPQISFEEGVAKMLQQLDYWREAPLWTPGTIAVATQAWFQALSNKKRN